MIAVDTNVIVRLLTKDDKTQYRNALAVFKKPDTEIYVSLTILQETEWVLRYSYQFPREVINSAFRQLLGLPNVVTGSSELLNRTLIWHLEGLDFSDALHLSQSVSCDAFYSFDQELIKRCRKVISFPVKKPG